MSTENANNGVTIAVMGATGAGKSTFINAASAAKLQVGEGLESCTAEVQPAPPFLLDGKYVTLIDTPGFDDTVKTEAEVLRLISTFLAATYESGRRLSGVIFLHRISDVRIGGVAKKNFRLFKKLCGDETLRNVIIATNMWGEVSLQKGELRERELATNELFFKPALDKGARMIRHDNTPETAHHIIQQVMKRPDVVLAIQREMVDEHKTVPQTAAGLDLQAELNDQMKKHRREVKAMQERMEALLKEKDAKHQEELKDLNEAVIDVREQMQKVRSHSEKLQDEREADKRKYEAEAEQMTRAMQEREDKLRDLHEFAQSQKDMLLEMRESLMAVQNKAEQQDAEKEGTEEKLKSAHAAHKAELDTLRQEFEEKLAAVLGSASSSPSPSAPTGTAPPTGKTAADGPPVSPISGPRARAAQAAQRSKSPPGFFSGLALVLDQLFVPQLAI